MHLDIYYYTTHTNTFSCCKVSVTFNDDLQVSFPISESNLQNIRLMHHSLITGGQYAEMVFSYGYDCDSYPAVSHGMKIYTENQTAYLSFSYDDDEVHGKIKLPHNDTIILLKELEHLLLKYQQNVIYKPIHNGVTYKIRDIKPFY